MVKLVMGSLKFDLALTRVILDYIDVWEGHSEI